MNSEPILEVRHLNVWYRPSGVLCRGRQQVLHDVSFDLYRGEILGLSVGIGYVGCLGGLLLSYQLRVPSGAAIIFISILIYVELS